MTTTLNWRDATSYSASVSQDLFGGNFLFDRDRPFGTYGTVFDHLGLTHVRYPGGTITERFFDITNPDATRAFDTERGTFRDLVPLTEFLTWAGSENIPVSLVLPTLSLMKGPEGSRVPKDSTYDDVKTFIIDVLSGVYGSAPIDAIELGNEYWLGGEMNVTEYARIADTLARAVQDGIDTFKAGATLPSDWSEPAITVQVGQFGKFSTDPGWMQNAYLIDALSPDAADAIDAVTMHYYVRGAFERLPEHGYYFDRLNEWREDRRFADIEFQMTEWSTEHTDTEESGLRQASAMVWMVSEMVAQNVSQAHVWPVQQNTRNDLSGDEGVTDLTLAGEGMRLMTDVLVGAELQHRLTYDGGVAYVYGHGRDTVVFLASRDAEPQQVRLDLSDLGRVNGPYALTILGTAGATNDPDALPRLRMDAERHPGSAPIELTLDPYEIARLVFSDRGPHDLDGSAGADTITGGQGDDTLNGRAGADQLSGDAGADLIQGGTGEDTLLGGAGSDTVLGGDGDDVVRSGQGQDQVSLGNGDDVYEDAQQVGADGADKVYGGAGADILRGFGGQDRLSGEAGNDSLFGGLGADALLGGYGDDVLLGEAGSDDIVGGHGEDHLEGGDGDDTLLGGTGADILRGDAGNDDLFGDGGDDSLDGGEGDDVLSAGPGNDVVIGADGYDILAGGDGKDTLTGGMGGDTFVFDRDDGKNVITDFSTKDQIDLRGQGLFFDKVAMDVVADGLQISFAGTDVLLLDVAGPLTEDAFLFY